MASNTLNETGDPAEFEVALAGYQAELEAGRVPDRAAVLARYPHLAVRLRQFFAELDRQEAPTATIQASVRDPEQTIAAEPKSGASTPPVRLDDYELLGEISKGGMGVVYRARQLSLNRMVALKMILRGELAVEEEVQRFQREAEAAAALDHPHIVPIYQISRHQGQPFFSMKLIEGGSLKESLRKGRFPTSRQQWAAQLLEKVARAVHFAHQRGILHRDLKPGNILLDDRGEPHITDFGLAKQLTQAERRGAEELTQTGIAVGTPSYMPPEQAQGKKDLTTAADVYSLGAVLYEMLTGRPPFRGPSNVEILLQVVTQEPIPPRSLDATLSRDLETVCLKCLEKDPGNRYGSALELAEELRRWQTSEPIHARPGGTWERLVKWLRRRPATAALLGVSGTALLAILVLLGLLYQGRLTRLAAIAEEERKGREGVERENDRFRRSLLTAQLWRAAGVWAHDPLQARALLDDERACPPELRDFTWRYYHQHCQPLHYTSTGHRGEVSALALSPQGDLFASGSNDREIRLWELSTGKEVGRLVGHTDEIWAVAFGRDGKRLYSGSRDGVIKVWDVTARREVKAFPKLAGCVWGLAVSPDGQTLASASCRFDPAETDKNQRWKDGAVTLWDLQTGATRQLADSSNTAFLCIAFSPEGRFLAVGQGSGSQVRLWDLQQPKRTLTTSLGGSGWIQGVQFSPVPLISDSQGITVLLGMGRADHTLRLCEIKAGPGEGPASMHERPRLRGHLDELWSVAFSPDGKTVASAGWDGSVRLWDVVSGRDRLLLHCPLLRTVRNSPNHPLFFAPNGRHLVEAHGHVIRCWAIAPLHDGLTFRAQPASRIALASDGVTLVAGVEGDAVKLWDLPTGRALGLRSGPGPVTALASSRHETRLAAAHRSGSANGTSEIILWQGQDLSGASVLRVATPVQALALTPRQLLALGPGRLQVWELGAGNQPLQKARSFTWSPTPSQQPDHNSEHAILASEDTPHRFQVLPRGEETIFIVEPNNPLRVLHLATGEVQPHPEFGLGITAVALTGDGALLAVATQKLGGALQRSTQEVHLFDLTGQRSALQLERPEGKILALTFTPDGRSLVGGGADKLVRLWDVASGQLRAALAGHTREVHDLALSPDGQMVFSASAYRGSANWVRGGELKLWLAAQSGASAVALSSLEEAVSQLARWLERSRQEQAQGCLEKAIAALDQALELDHLDPALWAERGQLHSRLGHLTAACADFRQAHQLHPTSLNPALALAGHLVLLDRQEEYERLCREMMKRKFNATTHGAQIHTVRLCSYAPLPADLTRQVLALAHGAIPPGAIRSSWYRRDVATASVRAGEPQQAIALLEGVLRDGTPPTVLSWLGLALAHQRAGQVQQARDWLQQAETWMNDALKIQPPQAVTPAGLHVNDWLTCQVLRRELRRLLNPDPKKEN